ncbi:DegT/DnrJ/EryC1/StrS family aminotransferase [Phormidium tenue FACHB-886]|nr:DegT/DnrJ/EryC1/StrS family aminotransferase [Phormidium tenue FACHB-886]
MIPVQAPDLGDAEIAALIQCINSGDASGNSPTVEQFEREFAKAIGVPHAIAVNSGTAALHLAFLGLGLKPGDEVIVPSFSFAPCADMAYLCGVKPVFVDSDPEDFNLTYTAIKDAITDSTRAILAVHLYGHPCDLEPLLDLCYRRGIFLIEDCAQALGSQYQGQSVGSFGVFSCFSFYAGKIITTGEGGMVVTSDRGLATAVRSFRSHALSRSPGGIETHSECGFNYRMPAFNAAVGSAQLSRLDTFLERRINNAELYKELLASNPAIKLPALKPYCSTHSYWAFAVLLDEEKIGKSRKQVVQLLAQQGIETRPFYYPLHLHSLYRQQRRSLPNCESFAARGLTLPSGNTLTSEQVTRVCEVMQSICQPS